MNQQIQSPTRSFQLAIEDSVCTLDQTGKIILPTGYELIEFYVENEDSHYKGYGRSTVKTFSTFLGAFRDAIRKLERRANYASYKVQMDYKTPDNYKTTRCICYVWKRPNEAHAVMSIGKKNEAFIPNEWLPTKRQGTKEVDELISYLQKHYNVNQVIFRSSINKIKKLQFLQYVRKYFENMADIIDFHAFNPVDIATSTMTKWAATYDEWNTVINLVIYGEESLYHEYFHHIDLSTLDLRITDEENNFKELTEAGRLYNELVTVLEQTPTMKHFRHFRRRILDENGVVKLSQLNTKAGKHYIYWTTDIEITARFFDDVLRYHLWEKIDESIRPPMPAMNHFTINEVKEHRELMLTFIREVTTLSRESKDA